MNYFPVLFSFFDGNYHSGGDSMKNSSKKLLTSADWDIDIQACSATDCTGLIPSLPQDEAEMEAYEDLYPYITKAKNVAKTTKHNFSHRHQTE